MQPVITLARFSVALLSSVLLTGCPAMMADDYVVEDSVAAAGAGGEGGAGGAGGAADATAGGAPAVPSGGAPATPDPGAAGGAMPVAADAGAGGAAQPPACGGKTCGSDPGCPALCEQDQPCAVDADCKSQRCDPKKLVCKSGEGGG